MVEKVINNLILKKKGTYVDGTFGSGGHASAILKKLDAEGILTAFDRDENSKKIAESITSIDRRMRFFKDSFGNIENYFENQTLDGILLDLGISSGQLNDPERGFSFEIQGPLDMRMDQNSPLSAEDWLNNSSKNEIEKVLRILGEERFSKKIANYICLRRKRKPIQTTKDLVEIILTCKREGYRRHPATNAFRAIRMHVNSELEELHKLLSTVGRLLRLGGRLAVISFHSLEDRMVKRFIQGKDSIDDRSSFKLVSGKPMKPRFEEIKRNPRSRSAILRVAERTS